MGDEMSDSITGTMGKFDENVKNVFQKKHKYVMMPLYVLP